jgi:DNA/RNA endonuclease YhcR with UshA esterase domain
MQSGEAREVSLPGIIAPPTDGCFGAESTQLANDTTAGTVWLETVIGVDAPTVWVNDIANGTFTLLAFELVAAGAVDADGAGVYGAWLAPISDRLESEETGLWSNCRGTGGEFINPPTPTPAPSPTPVPTPSAEQVREGYTWVDTRELISRPFLFEGERIAISGEVFTLQVDQDGTFMQIWVDTPSGREAVVIGFLGNQTPGLYEGMYVTVYGVGAGTFEGTNSFGGVITQPVILADIVDY